MVDLLIINVVKLLTWFSSKLCDGYTLITHKFDAINDVIINGLWVN